MAGKHWVIDPMSGALTNPTKTKDEHGNINAAEGCDRCVCGCTYWENDTCTDCGRLIEQVQIIRQVDAAKYGNEVKLNVMFATMVHYRLPWLREAPITDLTEINAKYRRLGVLND